MKAKVLWQISVTTTREAEDAVAALLERLFGNPATIYSADGSLNSVATVYSSQTRIRSKREALEAGLQFLASCDLDLGTPRIVIRRVPREDWTHSWQKYFKTLQIGSRLVIRPSWIKRGARKGQSVVILDPGLSFGTGQHPTTAFCLRQLVKVRINGQDQSFLDIGTGSGILAISAVKLGYRPVRAFDLDPTAVRIAKSNARRNRVGGKLVIVREDLRKSPAAVRNRYDLICANLVDDLLIRERERILNRLRPGGHLVLAGVLAEQFAQVRQVYERAGLELQSFRIEGGWESGAFASRLRKAG